VLLTLLASDFLRLVLAGELAHFLQAISEPWFVYLDFLGS
jgi:hypothetical protein